MARPSATPRLRDIDPKAWAEDVVRLVTDHAISLLMQLHPTVTWSIPTDSLLRHEAEWLAIYAQRGLPVGDWAHHGNATDALISVDTALYTCAAPQSVPSDDDEWEESESNFDRRIDPRTEIGVVLLAASARIRIDREQSVPVRELACLASVDKRHVDLLGRQGEIAIVDGAVEAEECRRWLSARGIEGV